VRALLHRLKEQEGRVIDLLFAWRKVVFVARVRALAFVKRTKVDLEIGPGFQLGKRVVVKIAPRSSVTIHFGPHCRVGEGTLLLFTAGSLWCGEDVQFRRFNVVNVVGDLKLAGGNIFSYGTVIHCAEKVHLGKWSGCGEYATIVDSTHYFTEPDVCISRNTDTGPVIIGDNVFICPRATVNRGVRVADFVIIGPNSVVNKDIERGMFVSGVPAKPIRPIDLPWDDPGKVVETILAEAN
jgi:acetyltransferase-like isoleucine patch superfamily enzyme